MTEETTPALYFAYGSNMNAERMLERVGWNTPRFAAQLQDYELRFNKMAQDYGWCAANIVPASGRKVEGAVYKVTERELLILDGYEGVATEQYERQVLQVLDLQGCSWEVIAYVALNTGPDQPPTREYLDHLLAGKPLLSPEYFLKLQQIKAIE